MTPAAKKTWISLFATASTMILGAIIPSPAKAVDCVSGKLISEIVVAGNYSCRLGQQDYTFNSSVGELDNATQTSTIDFYDSQYMQQIIFTNTGSEDFVLFNYTVVSQTESIDDIQVSYTLSPSLPPPLSSAVATSSPLPYAGSPLPLTVDGIFDPDTSLGTQTLTSLTHTIYKSPAPLPLAGAGLAFGFSRKLRRRVMQASDKSASS
jgi:hypothetical protein